MVLAKPSDSCVVQGVSCYASDLETPSTAKLSCVPGAVRGDRSADRESVGDFHKQIHYFGRQQSFPV